MSIESGVRVEVARERFIKFIAKDGTFADMSECGVFIMKHIKT